MALDLLDDSFAGRSLIEASAGTGKTWTLTALYARLLLERQLTVGQILVVTYTTAATAELRERIRARLAALLAVYQGQPSDDAFLAGLQARFSDEASHRRVLLAVHGFDEAAIFTIHGFCQRALQDVAFEAGSDFDNSLAADDRALVDALLNDAWRHELARAEPAWAQFLVNQRITPAWLRQRLAPLLGKPYLQVRPTLEDEIEPLALEIPWQTAARLWAQDGAGWIQCLLEHDGLNQKTHKADSLRRWQVELDRYFADAARVFEVPDGLGKLGTAALEKATRKGCVPPEDHPLSGAFEQLVRSVEQARDCGGRRLVQLQVRLLHWLEQELPARKRAQRQLAFDDLLCRLQAALQGEAGSALAVTLRSRYPVALIDEFQDTDPVQYTIFSQIYPDGVGADLCFVGDPKQAIYAFRGADLATYLLARRQTPRHYSLPVNYRSTPPLIDALNQLFRRPQPFAWPGLDYPPVSAAGQSRPLLQLPDEAGDAPLTLLWLGDETLKKGAAEQLAAGDTARRIARLLAASAQQQAGFARPDGWQPLKGGDIAVLVASHSQAALVAGALDQHQVPSVRRGRDSVWHTEEAGELAAVLAAYAEPGREGLLRYALASRLLGRDSAALARSQQYQQEWDAEREAAERYHQIWLQQGFLRLFRSWLDEQGVAARLLAGRDGERRLTNLLHLGELLQAQSLRQHGMEPLLAWFADQREADGGGDDALLRLESDAERVQIVTIHTSKGLEYPLVFCPFLWDGRLLGRHQESARYHDGDQAMVDLGSDQLEAHLQQARAERFAEQLRLVYVALTRPRERLWLHWGPVAPCLAGTKGQYPLEGLHTSALAWLLHGRENLPEGVPALQALQACLADREGPALHQDLQALVDGSGGRIGCCGLLSGEDLQVNGLLRARPPARQAVLERTLQSTWRMGSFSGLVAGQHREAPDRDALPLADPAEPGNGIFAFPRGARAGTCLHGILEDWARGKDRLPVLITQALAAYGLPEAFAGLLQQHLQQVLHTDLDGQGLTLASLQPARRLPELGFTFPVAPLSVAPLRALLADPAMGLAAPLRAAAAHLEFEHFQGFLKGFIDLTFEHQGRWYILDYKSNWLGPEPACYRPEALLQALAGEHYYLQYLIYLVALRRFLRQRLASFADDQLGGAFYLFLRGMPEAGVFFTRPADVLMDALDQLFEGAA